MNWFTEHGKELLEAMNKTRIYDVNPHPMEKLTMDGIEYNHAFCKGLVEHLNAVRNVALAYGDFNTAVMVSHIIAIVNHYLNQIGEPMVTPAHFSPENNFKTK